jgi:PAS domain S-box-containing protein
MTTLERIFPGDSEMARRMRALDWSATLFGAVESWPESLRTSVSTCLNCAFPIILWWGPELAILYNDEYRAMLGPSKHPAALGQPGAKVWSEIWNVISPMLSRVLTYGEPTRSRDFLLHIDREGYAEESYFSFSYSPIHDGSGKVAGVFCPVIETTEKVIGERRLRTLRDLAAQCTRAGDAESVYDCAASTLADNPRDVPFAIIYHVESSRAARLAAAVGIEPGHPAAPRVVSLVDGPDPWSLSEAVAARSLVEVAGLGRRFDGLPSRAWPTAPERALVIPVALPGEERPHAIIVGAVSPMRALDADYRTFFELIATQVAQGLANATALEAERRRAEALAEVDRAKTAFFSNVSHEFRTPLTLMLGPLEDVLASSRGTLPDDVASTLRLVHRNGLRLLRLVNTLLEFSRIEAGRVEANYEPTDLVALTAELASGFRSAIERAGLRLALDCEPLGAPAYVDREMWEKIVLNLLSNAFKFTFEGGIGVSLRSRGDRIELAVEDTGVGIPPDALPKVFERFQRVVHDRARTHEGTGIGLALVDELARLHGGEVGVASVVGRGSKFTVSIPAGKEHLPADRIKAPRRLASTSSGVLPFLEEALRWLPDTEASDGEPPSGVFPYQSRSAASNAGAARPARILVADDNADMRDYLRRLLSSSWAVEAVEDGRRALERIAADPPDLVLTDVMMSELDGMGLLAALRADESTRTLPVILLSARAGNESRIEGLDAGADDYIFKPFNARELVARVGSQLAIARVRREAEAALRRRSEQFETLLNTAPLGVYLVDADFCIRAVNPIALPVFGALGEGVVGRDFDEISHVLWDEAYADEVVGIFRHTLETGEPYVASERADFRIDRGQAEYYDLRVDRITLPDGRHGLVCYFRDISAQVLARKAVEESRNVIAEADRRKTEFLATLAHELRNPLAPIRNALTILTLAGADAQATARARETIDRQVTHMVRLVDDLMEISRVTRGKIELDRATVDLAEVVRVAVETSKPLLDRAGHHLSLSLPSEPLTMLADPVRLAQVLSNLLNNAAKYTPDGGRISLEARRDGPAVVVSVRDDGLGIERAMLSKVFDIFMQAQQTYSRAQGGLGIGLTLERSLVELHGGTVEARSEGLGRGSEFVVRLPLEAAPAASAGKAGPQTLSIQRRILVVDDSRDAAVMLATLLGLLGAEVDVATDGMSALEQVRERRPDLVFLDIGMPGMDGYEVARRIRQDRDLGAVQLVALTGWGQEDDRRKSKEAGIDVHLVKPLDLSTLRAVLCKLAERSGHAALLERAAGGSR